MQKRRERWIERGRERERERNESEQANEREREKSWGGWANALTTIASHILEKSRAIRPYTLCSS